MAEEETSVLILLAMFGIGIVLLGGAAIGSLALVLTAALRVMLFPLRLLMIPVKLLLFPLLLIGAVVKLAIALAVGGMIVAILIPIAVVAVALLVPLALVKALLF